MRRLISAELRKLDWIAEESEKEGRRGREEGREKKGGKRDIGMEEEKEVSEFETERKRGREVRGEKRTGFSLKTERM